MTTNREAICQSAGHDWTGWGLWHADHQPQVAVPDYGRAAMPADIGYSKWRERRCYRCDAWERQDGSGQIIARSRA